MKKRIIFIIIGIVLVLGVGGIWWCISANRSSGFMITFFDIGQGDAALIKFENREKMLVDCGPDKTILSKLGKALPFWDRKVDFLVVTHFDLDHYGGCIDVLKRYEVRTIILTAHNKPADSYWREWKKQLDEEGAQLKIINGREELSVAGTTIQILSPFPALIFSSSTASSNNYSIVFRLLTSSSPYSVLFTGDIEETVEEQLVQEYCPKFDEESECPLLQVNILKVPHHGSDTSSSRDFLQAVSPEQAVISVGKQNKFGHPSLRVLKKLERANVTILRTDQKGDILIK